ncbi:hypothetical protein AMTR_s00038p00214460 [Amborella trichopoda]|uniref:Uncharacterized protein n=1 Tax=Amborella trichopoda TaxID=13333 RepID=U5CXJ1_AMBTC|nr:hypothetical protein AMTR_s00038p00214460 [Amborella trichopoda]
MHAKVPVLYTVGHMLCQHAITDSKLGSIGSSLWSIDTSMLDWVDDRPAGFVVYVNFGGIMVILDIKHLGT